MVIGTIAVLAVSITFIVFVAYDQESDTSIKLFNAFWVSIIIYIVVVLIIWILTNPQPDGPDGVLIYSYDAIYSFVYVIAFTLIDTLYTNIGPQPTIVDAQVSTFSFDWKGLMLVYYQIYYIAGFYICA